MLRCRSTLFVLLACLTACLLVACTTLPKVKDFSGQPKGWLAFPTIPPELAPSSDEQIYSWGELTLPERQEKRLPAVILLHASGGPDFKDESWARFFRTQGYATFRLDYFGPRGITANSAAQPLPTDDALAALRLLATHPKIDPARISIIGFSRGAVMALRAADYPLRSLPNGLSFAASIALYPTCSSSNYLYQPAGAPVLILIGSNDDLSSPQDCQSLVNAASTRGRTIELKVYAGAYHGWDGNWSGTWYHRALGHSYQIRADETVTARSQQDVMDFLSRHTKK